MIGSKNVPIAIQTYNGMISTIVTVVYVRNCPGMYREIEVLEWTVNPKVLHMIHETEWERVKVQSRNRIITLRTQGKDSHNWGEVTYG